MQFFKVQLRIQNWEVRPKFCCSNYIPGLGAFTGLGALSGNILAKIQRHKKTHHLTLSFFEFAKIRSLTRHSTTLDSTRYIRWCIYHYLSINSLLRISRIQDSVHHPKAENQVMFNHVSPNTSKHQQIHQIKTKDVPSKKAPYLSSSKKMHSGSEFQILKDHVPSICSVNVSKTVWTVSKKYCTTLHGWNCWNPINDGINHDKTHLSIGVGFLGIHWQGIWRWWNITRGDRRWGADGLRCSGRRLRL